MTRFCSLEVLQVRPFCVAVEHNMLSVEGSQERDEWLGYSLTTIPTRYKTDIRQSTVVTNGIVAR